MKIQRFKGYLKGTTSLIDGLIPYKDEDAKQYRFIKDLYWIDGYEYSAETYDIDEFDSLEEYFEEVDVVK